MASQYPLLIDLAAHLDMLTDRFDALRETAEAVVGGVRDALSQADDNPDREVMMHADDLAEVLDAVELILDDHYWTAEYNRGRIW